MKKRAQTAAVAKRPRGRPAKLDARKYTVKLTAVLADKAARIGEQDGKPNVTRGIEIAVNAYRS